jgi:holliday junction DNA helicase RuvA
MIGRLTGSVIEEDLDGSVLLDVHGVGYELRVPLGALGRAQTSNDAVTLHVHTHVREDALELFGFASDLERRVFRLLLGVPNVGPKTAIGVLSALSTDDPADAVQRGDLARLGKVPGIGKKTAERIVLELKEKLPRGVVSTPGPTRPAAAHGDADRLRAALVNMGYRPVQAERAVAGLGERIGREPLSDLVREALQALAV